MFGLEIEPENGPVLKDSSLIVPFNNVGPEFFRTLRIPLKQGRFFGPEDLKTAEQPLMINEGMAKRLWPNGDAAGKRIRFDPKDPWMRVVGVVGNVYEFRPSNRPGSMEAYYYKAVGSGRWSQQTLAVRTAADPEKLIPALKSQIWAVDKGQPITQIRTVEEMYAEFFGEQRFFLALMTVFAGVAILLATIGIYGVTSYSVTQRTKEFGIRTAFGAQPGDVLALVLRRGLALAVAGVAVGVVGALALTRYLGTLLFDVTPYDPATFIIVVGVLALASLAACYIPARRATNVDPMVTLRYE